MKQFFLAIVLFFALFFNSFSQTNHGINYQAVARDASGNLLENQTISVRFSIIEDSPTGNIIFSETHLAMTNKYGLFTLAVGTGKLVYGNFGSIDWSGG